LGEATAPVGPAPLHLGRAVGAAPVHGRCRTGDSTGGRHDVCSELDAAVLSGRPKEQTMLRQSFLARLWHSAWATVTTVVLALASSAYLVLTL